MKLLLPAILTILILSSCLPSHHPQEKGGETCITVLCQGVPPTHYIQHSTSEDILFHDQPGACPNIAHAVSVRCHLPYTDCQGEQANLLSSSPEAARQMCAAFQETQKDHE